MGVGPHMTVDADAGEVWFHADQAAMVCSALDAEIVNCRTLIWLERLDLRSGTFSLPLFHDEDGTSHLELTHLSVADRAEVLAMFTQAGFHSEAARPSESA
jgi:hypothetical protein